MPLTQSTIDAYYEKNREDVGPGRRWVISLTGTDMVKGRRLVYLTKADAMRAIAKAMGD